MMKTYTAIFEKAADGSWSAHIPDLPTIRVAGSDTFEEAQESMKTALELYAPSTQIVAAEFLVPYEPA
jgi:predicted RNase H-like HicB family nuclease